MNSSWVNFTMKITSAMPARDYLVSIFVCVVCPAEAVVSIVDSTKVNFTLDITCAMPAA